ncbi:MAG: hypothetical protein JWP72_3688 [Massilia sp.]|jgi:hypothetical protein|nr:hypothetical protein [Massilia sp.]MDB5790677.1 hypothetical protein [Massilia sp.]
MNDKSPGVTVRGFVPHDEDAVKAVSRAAFAQYGATARRRLACTPAR